MSPIARPVEKNQRKGYAETVAGLEVEALLNPGEVHGRANIAPL